MGGNNRVLVPRPFSGEDYQCTSRNAVVELEKTMNGELDIEIVEQINLSGLIMNTMSYNGLKNVPARSLGAHGGLRRLSPYVFLSLISRTKSSSLHCGFPTLRKPFALNVLVLRTMELLPERPELCYNLQASIPETPVSLSPSSTCPFNPHISISRRSNTQTHAECVIARCQREIIEATSDGLSAVLNGFLEDLAAIGEFCELHFEMIEVTAATAGVSKLGPFAVPLMMEADGREAMISVTFKSDEWKRRKFWLAVDFLRGSFESYSETHICVGKSVCIIHYEVNERPVYSQKVGDDIHTASWQSSTERFVNEITRLNIGTFHIQLISQYIVQVLKTVHLELPPFSYKYERTID
ncbi:hypothetical protein ARMSODRAFT_983418 [Armillaria solidipes]|uniref:Uncharacterized protein n=1 Tax=Armillaria solidipes TaxID=1076256 RepID=A0A2H3AJC5_9AGAR|nr:hypothetical protein ARMSODRAFT_983418 [Armillaria solidipes]